MSLLTGNMVAQVQSTDKFLRGLIKMVSYAFIFEVKSTLSLLPCTIHFRDSGLPPPCVAMVVSHIKAQGLSQLFPNSSLRFAMTAPYTSH